MSKEIISAYVHVDVVAVVSSAAIDVDMKISNISFYRNLNISKRTKTTRTLEPDADSREKCFHSIID